MTVAKTAIAKRAALNAVKFFAGPAIFFGTLGLITLINFQIMGWFNVPEMDVFPPWGRALLYTFVEISIFISLVMMALVFWEHSKDQLAKETSQD